MATSARRKHSGATTAKAWRASKAKEPIELPSGNMAFIKRPGMEKFLSAGYIPDSLAAEIRAQINGKTAKPVLPKGTEDEAGPDVGDVEDMLMAMDRCVAYCLVSPETAWHRRVVYEDGGSAGRPVVKLDDQGREVTEEIPEDERDEDILYTDELDQDDKNFVFQYAVGGSPDLARFRAATASALAAVEAGGKLGLQAE
jgi:hypothetical protein